MIYLGKGKKKFNKSLRHKEHNCDQCDNYGYDSKEELRNYSLYNPMVPVGTI